MFKIIYSFHTTAEKSIFSNQFVVVFPKLSLLLAMHFSEFEKFIL